MVEKYAKDDSLYPKDLKLRTKVNERLFYVASYIFPRAYQIFVPGYFGIESEIPQKKIDEMLRGYQTIEDFLKGNKYLTGDSLTLCDLFLWCNMESLNQVIPIDEEKFPNFFGWLNKMREEPTYNVNREGADDHISFYKDCIKQNSEKKQDD